MKASKCSLVSASASSFSSRGRHATDNNNLDNRKDPMNGWMATYKQDFAGVGGQSDFVRESFDARYFHPVVTEDTAAGGAGLASLALLLGLSIRTAWLSWTATARAR